MLVLTGGTASGKTTICKELIKLGMEKIVTVTTRPMRDGEIEGDDYFFVSDEEFEQMKKDNKFIETAEYNTAYGIWKYGTLYSNIKENGVIILNPNGIINLVKKDIDCSIFLIQTPISIIKRRLIQRGDSPEEYMRRISTDSKDFNSFFISAYVDYLIFNDESKTVENIAHDIYELYKNNNEEEEM